MFPEKHFSFTQAFNMSTKTTLHHTFVTIRAVLCDNASRNWYGSMRDMITVRRG